MKKLTLYFPMLILVMVFQNRLSAQCTIGDLNATNIAVSPSNLRSCNLATITAEWLNQAQVPYDAAFHEGVLLISLPTEFIGTTGTLTVSASDGNTYWNTAGVTLTDMEATIPLSGSIPSGITLTIIISDMEIDLNEPFALVNVTKSVSNAIVDCDPENDEQTIQVLLQPANAPLVSDITANCTETELSINLTATPGSGGGDISSFSWIGPNGFSSTDEDPSFNVPQSEAVVYRGDYTVMITDANGCVTSETISLDDVNCLALPIELLHFKAIPGKSDVKLEWKTATELNNSHFEIERSADGRNFQPIGVVAGHGTTSEVIAYEYIDGNPLRGKSFYRLKQVDFDGTFEYSPVEPVTFGGGSELKIFPNPASSGAEINIQGSKIRSVRVYNMVGQLIIDESYERPLDQVIISSGKLPQGMYITRINETSEKRLMIK